MCEHCNMRVATPESVASQVIRWRDAGKEEKEILVDIGRDRPIHLIYGRVMPFDSFPVRLYTLMDIDGQDGVFSCENTTRKDLLSWMEKLNELFDEGMI